MVGWLGPSGGNPLVVIRDKTDLLDGVWDGEGGVKRDVDDGSPACAEASFFVVLEGVEFARVNEVSHKFCRRGLKAGGACSVEVDGGAGCVFEIRAWGDCVFGVEFWGSSESDYSADGARPFKDGGNGRGEVHGSGRSFSFFACLVHRGGEPDVDGFSGGEFGGGVVDVNEGITGGGSK